MKLVGWALSRCKRLALGAIFAAIFSFGATAQETEPYLMAPGDVLDITVLEDPDLGRQVLVRPDGRISLPLVGTLMAAGRSPEQVTRIVRSRLSRNFVEPPSVTVAVVSVAEVIDEEEDPVINSVYVLGEVGRPGRFEYDSEEPITVLQALSLAGGPGPFAAVTRIQVREVVEDAEMVRLFDYERVQEGAGVTADDFRPLKDGAILIVPERGFFE